MAGNQSHASDEAQPISILACGGSLPLEVAQILRDAGRRINIVSINGMADADYSGFSQTSVSIGRIGALLKALKANDAREMIIAGHARRPDLRSLNIDWGFVRHIMMIMSLTRGGDDHVLRKIAGFFERCGLTVRSIADVAPALLTPPGAIVGQVTTTTHLGAGAGLQLVHQLGPFDVGQAVVMEDNAVIAIEGAEGTDGLLARLPPADNRSKTNSTRTLVKAAKPEQDLRVDLPTIGAATIERCKQSGVRHIALETGRSLIVSRAETIKQAHAANITIVGLEGTKPSTSTEEPKHPTRLVHHARIKPTAQAVRDASKGVRLLSVLALTCPVRATIVARENVLAISLDEATGHFIERTEKLAQWGDRREKRKRNRTLVLHSMEELETGTLDYVQNSKIAGIAFVRSYQTSAKFDQLVSDANARNLFVLSPE